MAFQDESEFSKTSQSTYQSIQIEAETGSFDQVFARFCAICVVWLILSDSKQVEAKDTQSGVGYLSSRFGCCLHKLVECRFYVCLFSWDIFVQNAIIFLNICIFLSYISFTKLQKVVF